MNGSVRSSARFTQYEWRIDHAAVPVDPVAAGAGTGTIRPFTCIVAKAGNRRRLPEDEPNAAPIARNVPMPAPEAKM